MRQRLLALIALASVSGCIEEPGVKTSYVTLTSTTHNCGAAANVAIDVSNGTFRLTGTCEKIRLSGSGNNLVIEAAKSVEITGPNNVVEVDAVDRLRAHSAGNTIRFKKGLSGRALDVVAIGDNNTLNHSD